MMRANICSWSICGMILSAFISANTFQKYKKKREPFGALLIQLPLLLVQSIINQFVIGILFIRSAFYFMNAQTILRTIVRSILQPSFNGAL